MSSETKIDLPARLCPVTTRRTGLFISAATFERTRLVDQRERSEFVCGGDREIWIDEPFSRGLLIDDAFLFVKCLHACNAVEGDRPVWIARLPIHPVEKSAVVDDLVGDHHVDELVAVGTPVIGLAIVAARARQRHEEPA